MSIGEPSWWYQTFPAGGLNETHYGYGYPVMKDGSSPVHIRERPASEVMRAWIEELQGRVRDLEADLAAARERASFNEGERRSLEDLLDRTQQKLKGAEKDAEHLQREKDALIRRLSEEATA